MDRFHLDPMALKGIPAGVAADVDEAIRAANAACPRAAAVMLRRATEGVAAAEGINNGRLVDKINALEQKGILSRVQASMAHAVRAFGNYGAHVGDDLLDAVDQEELDAAVMVTAAILSGLAKAKLTAASAVIARKAKARKTQRVASALRSRQPAHGYTRYDSA